MVIDNALARVIAQHPEREVSPEATTNSTSTTVSSYDQFSDSGSFRLDRTPAHLRALTNNALQMHLAPSPISPALLTSIQEAALRQWLHDKAMLQLEQIQWEDDCTGAPLHSALRTLYGPLREFLDFLTMAANCIAHLELLADAASIQQPLPSPPSFHLDPRQSPTSLDFSLPDATAAHDPGLSDTTVSATMTVAATPGTAVIATGDTHTNRHGKRKFRGDDPEPEQKRKKFRKSHGDILRRAVIEHEAYKAVGLTNTHAICMFTGVRLAVLAGKECIEQFVREHYSVDETYLPSGHVTHPLLTNLEAAQLHVMWKVLHQHQQYILASLVFDILTFRLRDVYAVSHLLNAGYLGTQYPGARHWELLPFDDLESITSAAALNFQADYTPDYGLNNFDEDSEIDDVKLQYPASDDEYPLDRRYSPDTESSTIFTDSEDIESTAESNDAPGITAGSRDAEQGFYICRVGNWFWGNNDARAGSPSDTDRRELSDHKDEELIECELVVGSPNEHVAPDPLATEA
ncbi:hypothetical protein B0H17DRAFT_1131263 [Mycena rosella]|uniref:Uncharacterized protein n=1 Tax=Mycena rosella TaxID=1033263 RepID=A0AAD7DMW9_MYCRO|nr:hypothetical protein B0H17DRAFT_1131263 [Mycena rosella]